ncbi:hypothetical protein E8E13_009908 [Curvularia kusanoi]|uniref:RRM domain-containing protein n=1 Tax=Curvularia kusanoi TaxID=90978 RepID=A0A9P4TM99_CURKU|nr:hypothetical protein E8E13_009908 [Curvularia kusanoi]
MANSAPPSLQAENPNGGSEPQISEPVLPSSADSDTTVIATRPETIKSQLIRGKAIFSTCLGTQPQRKLRGPRRTPVIARSDKVRDVVVAAGFWRDKYPYQYFCIFPGGDWKTEDFWDEEDIHLETDSFCREVLRFIERDNCVRAQQYSQEWAQMYPERLSILGGDMTKLYDTQDPLFVVDKIFVNNETHIYPPIFLWHAAHIIRKAMLTVKGVELPLKSMALEALVKDQNNAVTKANSDMSAAVGGLAALPTMGSNASMNTVSTHAFVPPNPIMGQHIRARHPDRAFSPTQGYNAVMASGTHPEFSGHSIPVPPTHQTRGTNVASSLRIHKNRSDRRSSGTHSQFMSSGSCNENASRVPSGLGPRQNAGPALPMQSPRYAQSPTAMNMSMSPGMTQAGYVHPNMMMHGGMMSQAYPPNVVRPGMLPPYAMPNPLMDQGYHRNTSDPQSLQYQMPMSDVTNMHHTMSVVPHDADGRRRRSSHQQMSTSSLFDPYEGNNPSFRTTGYTNGKKYGHSNSQHLSGRQGKASFPGNRSFYGQQGPEQPGFFHGAPSYVSHPGGPGPRHEVNRDVAENPQYGCNENWIGPLNEVVKELYLRDLPVDIQDSEIEAAFFEKIGIKPTFVKVFSNASKDGNSYVSNRRGAFVGFPTSAVARDALGIRVYSVRGQPIPVSVPRKFFRKDTETSLQGTMAAGLASSPRYAVNTNSREVRNRATSNQDRRDVTAPVTTTESDLSYSPQDARSDLPKTKKKNKQSHQSSAMTGSPESRKTKPKKRQGSPKKENRAASAGEVSVEATQQTTEVDVVKPSPKKSSKANTTGEAPKEKPQRNESSSPDANKTASLVEDQEKNVVDDSAKPVGALGKAGDAPDFLTSEPQNTIEGSPRQQPPLDIESLSEAREILGSGEEPEKVEVVTTQPASTEIEESKAIASEDGTNNEANFHSAAESQTEMTVRKEARVRSESVNRGSTCATPEVAKITDDSITAPSVLTVEIIPADTSISLQDDVPPAPPTIELPASAEKVVIMPPTDSKTDQPVTTAERDNPTFTTVSVTVDPPKKAGAQQTESLHPFSKAAKAQAKREREQKKKAQKKEKEQAEKAKIAKAAAEKSSLKDASAENDVTCGATSKISKSRSTDDAKSAEGEPAVGPSATIAADVSTDKVVSATLQDSQPNPTAVASTQITHDHSTSGKGKGKKRDTSIDASEETVANHGKQLGGIVGTSNEASLVTDTEVNTKMPNAPPDPDAPSSKQEEMDEGNTVPTEAATAVSFVEDPLPSAKKKPKKKKKKAPPAWPNLDFRPKSPNPSWMGPIDTATDTQNYEEIMTKAIGGDDDSEFSWSDLPKVEDILPPEEGDYVIKREESGGDQVPELIKKRVASLAAQSAELKAEKVLIDQQLTELESMRAANKSSPPIGEASTSSSKAGQDSNDASSEGALHNAPATHKEETTADGETDIAVANAQVAPIANAQLESDAGASLSAKKKKKPNNRKNKKKKKAPENTEIAEGTVSTSTTALNDPVDPNDPFSGQLEDIAALEHGNQEPALRGGHTEGVQTCDEPKLMRTMEAYFKETQGFGQPNGNNTTKRDGRN